MAIEQQMQDDAKMGIQAQLNQMNGYGEEEDEDEEDEDEHNFDGGQHEVYNPLRHKQY